MGGCSPVLAFVEVFEVSPVKFGSWGAVADSLVWVGIQGDEALVELCHGVLRCLVAPSLSRIFAQKYGFLDVLSGRGGQAFFSFDECVSVCAKPA